MLSFTKGGYAVIIANMKGSVKKFRSLATFESTCNCGSCNCNCGSQLISKDLESKILNILNS